MTFLQVILKDNLFHSYKFEFFLSCYFLSEGYSYFYSDSTNGRFLHKAYFFSCFFEYDLFLFSS